MKIKSTKEILESEGADEYFDILHDLESSELPNEKNIDYARLKGWCATYNDTWIKLDDLCNAIILMSSENKTLKDLYEKIMRGEKSWKSSSQKMK